MLRARLSLQRLSADHQLLESREQPARSFVLGFIQLLYLMHAEITRVAYYEMKDIANTTRRASCEPSHSASMRGVKGILQIGAPGGRSGQALELTYNYISYAYIVGSQLGIIVGRGTNAVVPTDYTLQTACVQGTAANQFEYGGCEVLPPSVSHPNAQFAVRRYLTNSSAGSITINEVGIYASGYDESAGTDHAAFPVCIARDLVAGGIAVAATELLRVVYTILVTV